MKQTTKLILASLLVWVLASCDNTDSTSSFEQSDSQHSSEISESVSSFEQSESSVVSIDDSSSVNNDQEVKEITLTHGAFDSRYIVINDTEEIEELLTYLSEDVLDFKYIVATLPSNSQLLEVEIKTDDVNNSKLYKIAANGIAYVKEGTKYRYTEFGAIDYDAIYSFYSGINSITLTKGATDSSIIEITKSKDIETIQSCLHIGTLDFKYTSIEKPTNYYQLLEVSIITRDINNSKSYRVSEEGTVYVQEGTKYRYTEYGAIDYDAIYSFYSGINSITLTKGATDSSIIEITKSKDIETIQSCLHIGTLDFKYTSIEKPTNYYQLLEVSIITRDINNSKSYKVSEEGTVYVQEGTVYKYTDPGAIDFNVLKEYLGDNEQMEDEVFITQNPIDIVDVINLEEIKAYKVFSLVGSSGRVIIDGELVKEFIDSYINMLVLSDDNEEVEYASSKLNEKKYNNLIISFYNSENVGFVTFTINKNGYTIISVNNKEYTLANSQKMDYEALSNYQ